jgi:hypothetical protein
MEDVQHYTRILGANKKSRNTMKPSNVVVAIFAILLLGGCLGSITKEKTNTIDITQRQVRNGIVYQDNDPNPYTGEVTGFYKNGQKASEEY